MQDRDTPEFQVCAFTWYVFGRGMLIIIFNRVPMIIVLEYMVLTFGGYHLFV